MMSLTKLSERTPLTVALVVGCLVLPAAAQVVPPPEEKPPATPDYVPPAPINRPPPAPSNPRTVTPRPAPAPDVPYEPITVRDNEGRIVPLTEPIEYVAIAHNPLIDLATLSRFGTPVQERRARMEALVVSNIDLLNEVEGGFIEGIRTADEAAFSGAMMKLIPLITSVGSAKSLTTDLVERNAVNPSAGALTQKIAAEHTAKLTEDAKNAPDTGDVTAPDRMLRVTLGTSLSEINYFYRRLMLEAADSMRAVSADLDLTDEQRAAIAPMLDRLDSESDFDARAEIIREIFAQIPSQARKAALVRVIGSRPEIDGSALLVVPAGAIALDLDNETRFAILMSLVDGVTIDTSDLVE